VSIPQVKKQSLSAQIVGGLVDRNFNKILLRNSEDLVSLGADQVAHVATRGGDLQPKTSTLNFDMLATC
jgi:hypothetical protein